MCQCCGLPHVTDFRILKIVSSLSSGVLNNHKGEILPFCSETKIEISVCVPSLTRAHNPPICKPSNFGEEQQQQVRKYILRKNDPIFSKTLAVDKSFWTATNTSPTAWVKKRILLDLRILAALVSMLARKHFLSNLHSPDSEIYCQSACILCRQLCSWRYGSQKI